MKLARLVAALALFAVLGTSVLACTAPAATPTTEPSTLPSITSPVATTPVVTQPAVSTPTPAAPVTTTPAGTTPVAAPTDYLNSGLLVNVKWLNDHSADSNLVIIDTRSNSDYAAGHIKNSVNIPPGTFDINTANVSPADKTALMNPQDAAAILGQLWISDTSKIVIYAAGVDSNAGRVFWALDYLGASDIHILNGGITSWKSANYAVTTDTSRTIGDPKTFVVKVNDKALATKAYVLANYNNPKFSVVDSRNATDWIVKRIPGTINILMADYLNTDGSVKSYADMSAFLTSKGITTDKTIITHCYVGYRSSQAYFIFRLMGYNVSNYDGSTTEWFADPSLPTQP